MKPKDRERLVLTIGAVAFILIAYFAFFIIPTTKSIKMQQMQINANTKNLGEIKRLLEEYRKVNVKKEAAFEGSLSAFVEKQASEAGITIAYIRPYGEKGEGVEVKVDEMEGKKLIQFLYEMDKMGIRTSRLNMRDYKGLGIWVVKISLES